MTDCPRCGLSIIGEHKTAEDCLIHLAPRYKRAQLSLEAMHRRYRALEERLERSKIQERVARQEAKRNGTLPVRLARLEAMVATMSPRMQLNSKMEVESSYRLNRVED
jgi:hypothetical protein